MWVKSKMRLKDLIITASAACSPSIHTVAQSKPAVSRSTERGNDGLGPKVHSLIAVLVPPGEGKDEQQPTCKHDNGSCLISALECLVSINDIHISAHLIKVFKRSE